MSIDATNEMRFEEDMESFFLSPAGGYVKGTDTYDPKLGLYVNTRSYPLSKGHSRRHGNALNRQIR